MDLGKLTNPVLAIALLGLVITACDTGFGQPCSLPKSQEFRQACGSAPVERQDAGPNDPKQESKASCAVKNYAGCETRVCLVYRGSSSFCSEACESDGDCEGSAVCRPIMGDADLDPTICQPKEGQSAAECYCIRKKDANR